MSTYDNDYEDVLLDEMFDESFEDDLDKVPPNIMDNLRGTIGDNGPRTSDDIGISRDDDYLSR